jgi:hypothetical protein
MSGRDGACADGCFAFDCCANDGAQIKSAISVTARNGFIADLEKVFMRHLYLDMATPLEIRRAGGRR